MNEPNSGPAVETPPRRVLLVEDNSMLALNVHEMLLEAGVEEVAVGASLTESLALAEAGGFEFAILDFDLGGESSVDVALRLAQAGVPFAFASGYGAEMDVPSELRDRPVLTKPFLQEELEAILLHAG